MTTLVSIACIIYIAPIALRLLTSLIVNVVLIYCYVASGLVTKNTVRVVPSNKPAAGTGRSTKWRGVGEWAHRVA